MTYGRPRTSCTSDEMLRRRHASVSLVYGKRQEIVEIRASYRRPREVAGHEDRVEPIDQCAKARAGASRSMPSALPIEMPTV